METREQLLEKYEVFKEVSTLETNILLKIFKNYPEKFFDLFKEKKISDNFSFYENFNYLAKEYLSNIKELYRLYKDINDKDIGEDIFLVLALLYQKFNITEIEDYFLDCFQNNNSEIIKKLIIKILISSRVSLEELIKIIDENYEKFFNQDLYNYLLYNYQPSNEEQIKKIFLKLNKKKSRNFIYFFKAIDKFCVEIKTFYYRGELLLNKKNISKEILKKIFLFRNRCNKAKEEDFNEILNRGKEIIIQIEEELKKLKQSFYKPWYGIIQQYKFFFFELSEEEQKSFFKEINNSRLREIWIDILVRTIYFIYFSIIFLFEEELVIFNFEKNEQLEKFIRLSNFQQNNYIKDFLHYHFNKRYPDDKTKIARIKKYITYLVEKENTLTYFFELFNLLLDLNLRLEKEDISFKNFNLQNVEKFLKYCSIYSNLYSDGVNKIYENIEKYLTYLLKYNYLDKIKEFLDVFLLVGTNKDFVSYFFALLDDEYKIYFLQNHSKFYFHSFQNFLKIILYYLDKDFIPIVEEYQKKTNSNLLKALLFYLKLYNNEIKFDKNLDYEKLLDERYFYWIKANNKFEILLFCLNCQNYFIAYCDKIYFRNHNLQMFYIDSLNYTCPNCNCTGSLMVHKNIINLIYFNKIIFFNSFIYDFLDERNKYNFIDFSLNKIIVPFYGEISSYKDLVDCFLIKNDDDYYRFFIDRIYFSFYINDYWFFYYMRNLIDEFSVLEFFYGLYKFYNANNDKEEEKNILNKFYKLYVNNDIDYIGSFVNNIPIRLEIITKFNKVFVNFIKMNKLKVPENKCFCGSSKKYNNCCFKLREKGR